MAWSFVDYLWIIMFLLAVWTKLSANFKFFVNYSRLSKNITFSSHLMYMISTVVYISKEFSFYQYAKVYFFFTRDTHDTCYTVKKNISKSCFNLK